MFCLYFSKVISNTVENGISLPMTTYYILFRLKSIATAYRIQTEMILFSRRQDGTL